MIGLHSWRIILWCSDKDGKDGMPSTVTRSIFVDSIIMITEICIHYLSLFSVFFISSLSRRGRPLISCLFTSYIYIINISFCPTVLNENAFILWLYFTSPLLSITTFTLPYKLFDGSISAVAEILVVIAPCGYDHDLVDPLPFLLALIHVWSKFDPYIYHVDFEKKKKFLVFMCVFTSHEQGSL